MVPFLEKMAPNAAPSPLSLKTPEMEAGKEVKAIGVNPGILRGFHFGAPGGPQRF